jgi:hypothetical protein
VCSSRIIEDHHRILRSKMNNEARERKRYTHLNPHYCKTHIDVRSNSMAGKRRLEKVERPNTPRERARYSCSIHSMHFPNSAIFSYAYFSPRVSDPVRFGSIGKVSVPGEAGGKRSLSGELSLLVFPVKYRPIGIFPARLHEGSLIGILRAAAVGLINIAKGFLSLRIG